MFELVCEVDGNHSKRLFKDQREMMREVERVVGVDVGGREEEEMVGK
jgi:hypothetical protein